MQYCERIFCRSPIGESLKKFCEVRGGYRLLHPVVRFELTAPGLLASPDFLTHPTPDPRTSSFPRNADPREHRPPVPSMRRPPPSSGFLLDPRVFIRPIVSPPCFHSHCLRATFEALCMMKSDQPGLPSTVRRLCASRDKSQSPGLGGCSRSSRVHATASAWALSG